MFNHQARWDRELPHDAAPAGAPIVATCRVENGSLTPDSFIWRGQTFPVTKINFRWKDKKGEEVLFYFSVSTPRGTYEIVFSRERLTWHLSRLVAP